MPAPSSPSPRPPLLGAHHAWLLLPRTLLAVLAGTWLLTASSALGAPRDNPVAPSDLGEASTASEQFFMRPPCDPLDPSVCLQPWPNNYFTTIDPSTPTGLRLRLPLGGMPRNLLGMPIDPADYNLLDGFSPGNVLVTRVPGLDTPQAFANTGAAPITDIARYADPDQPIVVIDTATGQRHPIWAELDANPTDPANVNLLIHPAVNFREGARYVVALRRLKDAAGNTLEASRAFKIFRDRIWTLDLWVELRRPHMEALFSTLGAAGIARGDLYLAWDFTVASRQGLSRRLLHIRDDAFALLGDTNLGDLRVQGRAPNFAVTRTTELAPCGDDGCQEGEDDLIARRVEGLLSVPCYLDLPLCISGGRFRYGSGEVPIRLPGNIYPARFLCSIPRSVADGPHVTPARPALYGHGLFGSALEVQAENVARMANEHRFVFCATDWIGMSSGDLPNTALILADLSLFPALADRVQQGMLDFLYLGRAMIHPGGFNSHPAFQFDKEGQAEPVLDTTRLFYDGNSQGGILGGALAAVAPDHERAVLGALGMNYSLLLPRSVDFDRFARMLFLNYPSEIQRPLLLSLLQLLWDRGEANGYAHHMTGDPYPNTPPHTVLLHVAFGDHQVANVAAEVEARTIGARVYQPALDPGRSPDVTPFWGIPPVPAFPYRGSAHVVWDIGPLRVEDGVTLGTPPPPTANVPPRLGRDPHGAPRNEPAARLQKARFLEVDGELIDACGGHPCYAEGWTGPP